MLRSQTLIRTAALTLLSGTALAQVDPNSGIDFVTIGDVGNANWTGGGSNNNRGRVDYEYKIGKFEVTTSQWVEFMNAALDRPSSDRIPHVYAPSVWGAQGTPAQNGGSRWRVPAGREMLPTGGVDWRVCAIYCNWLHNGKSLDRSAFLSGAYDVDTFQRYNGGATYTDQVTRSPGARYFIPSLDEWMKAAHWDPNKPNTDGTSGGWWTYSNSSDTPYNYGPAGQRVVQFPGTPAPDPEGPFATANAGWDNFDFPGFSPYSIPLGSYTGVTSPWGLMDVAGATSEWVEEAFRQPGEIYLRSRSFEGSAWDFRTNGIPDMVRSPRGGGPPDLSFYEVGFRVASIPAPGMGSLGVGLSVLSLRRRRR